MQEQSFPMAYMSYLSIQLTQTDSSKCFSLVDSHIHYFTSCLHITLAIAFLTVWFCFFSLDLTTNHNLRILCPSPCVLCHYYHRLSHASSVLMSLQNSILLIVILSAHIAHLFPKDLPMALHHCNILWVATLLPQPTVNAELCDKHISKNTVSQKNKWLNWTKSFSLNCPLLL